MKRAVVAFILLAPVLLRACLNDRDTLGFELRNRPDAQMALTGRFERNPPLYYQMRVARLRAKGRLSPAENDDLAVALDRLGRSEEALAALTAEGRKTADERYRFYANRGTFRAHWWFKRGAKSAEIGELKVAESDIQKALEINPQAHFGREATQLEVIRWLVKTPAKADYGPSLADWLQNRGAREDFLRGLSGLIVLGGAWESPDVAIALAELADGTRNHALAELAHARYQELLAAGRKPLNKIKAEQAAESLRLGLEPPKGEPPVKLSFRKLREEAESWHRVRTQYMTARLEQGRHPDTDPSFWSEWKERPMPRLDPQKVDKPLEIRGRWIVPTFIATFTVLVVVLFFAGRFLLRRFRLRAA